MLLCGSSNKASQEWTRAIVEGLSASDWDYEVWPTPHTGSEWGEQSLAQRAVRRVALLAHVARRKPRVVVFTDVFSFVRTLPFLTALVLLSRIFRLDLCFRGGDCGWIISRQIRPNVNWLRWAVFLRLLKSPRVSVLSVTSSEQSDLYVTTGVLPKVIGQARRRPTPERTRAYGRTAESPIVLNVASVRRRKGTEEFIRIAAAVKRSRPDVRFVWIGLKRNRKKPFRVAMESLATECGVELLEYSDEVLRFMRDASLLLFTSRSEAGAGVLVEAMSVGLPIVTFGGTGAEDLVGEVGRVVAAGDVEGAARAVIETLALPEAEWLRLSNAHASRFEQTFAPEPAAKRLLEVIDSSPVEPLDDHD